MTNTFELNNDPAVGPAFDEGGNLIRSEAKFENEPVAKPTDSAPKASAHSGSNTLQRWQSKGMFQPTVVDAKVVTEVGSTVREVVTADTIASIRTDDANLSEYARALNDHDAVVKPIRGVPVSTIRLDGDDIAVLRAKEEESGKARRKKIDEEWKQATKDTTGIVKDLAEQQRARQDKKGFRAK